MDQPLAHRLKDSRRGAMHQGAGTLVKPFPADRTRTRLGDLKNASGRGRNQSARDTPWLLPFFRDRKMLDRTLCRFAAYVVTERGNIALCIP